MIAVLAFALALQQPPTPTPRPTPPAPAVPAPAPVRKPTAVPTSLQVTVTDRGGAPASGVQVTVEGPVSREGVTDGAGQVQFKTMSAGTYRLRASHQAYVTLEKEVALRTGVASPPVEMTLSPAPPPPPAPAPPVVQPPPPAAAAAGPAAKPGDARVLSIADLAERSLSGKEPVKLVPVACSGLDTTQMIVLRETMQSPSVADVDRMLYVVAGEATLSMGGRDQTVSSGWFAMVPRGTAHTLTRKGRNPAIVLLTAGGQPCGS